MNDTAPTTRWSAVRAKSLARRDGIDTSPPEVIHAEEGAGKTTAAPRTGWPAMRVLTGSEITDRGNDAAMEE